MTNEIDIEEIPDVPTLEQHKRIQEEIKVKSVYEGLVRLVKSHNTLYGTNGKSVDTMRFDLTMHSVAVGSKLIINHGRITSLLLETNTVKIDITNLPWLTRDEQVLDPVVLFNNHYTSIPNGGEKCITSNFPAKHIDDMTNAEVMNGITRSEARVALEAWILCASLDGTLEKYVKAQPNFDEKLEWWKPQDTSSKICIMSKWWKTDNRTNWEISTKNNTTYITKDTKDVIATVTAKASNTDTRKLVMANRLTELVASLSEELFKLQLKTKNHNADMLCAEADNILKYINTGIYNKNK